MKYRLHRKHKYLSLITHLLFLQHTQAMIPYSQTQFKVKLSTLPARDIAIESQLGSKSLCCQVLHWCLCLCCQSTKNRYSNIEMKRQPHTSHRQYTGTFSHVPLSQSEPGSGVFSKETIEETGVAKDMSSSAVQNSRLHYEPTIIRSTIHNKRYRELPEIKERESYNWLCVHNLFKLLYRESFIISSKKHWVLIGADNARGFYWVFSNYSAKQTSRKKADIWPHCRHL